MPAVLKHKLLPAPVSLAEMNGTFRTGNKSVLADELTEDIVCPEAIELYDSSSCLIIDGQALVAALGKPNNAVTFGDLADTYVRAVLKAGSNYQRIDIVFNGYREETIKDATRTQCTKATGCITTSYIANHAKRSSWKVFKEHHKFLINLVIGGVDHSIRP